MTRIPPNSIWWDTHGPAQTRWRPSPYALVGGYAIASHGFSRQSEDIDLLVNPTAENSRRWIVALSQLPDQATRALEHEPDVFADDKRYALRVNELCGIRARGGQ